MEKHFALINNIVEKVIVADDAFIEYIKDKYFLIIDVTNITRPAPGDSYDPKTQDFISNHLEYIHIPTDPEQEHLKRGTEIGFDTIKLSKYDVSCANEVVTMGCKKLSAISLLDALHKFLVDKQEYVPGWQYSNEGPGYGKFVITWKDAQKLYEVLKKVKL